MSEIQEFASGDPDVPEGGSGFEFRHLTRYALFLWHAVRRHAPLALMVALLTLGATGVLLYVWPKTYQVEAKLLARRNDLMTSLSNPGRPSRPEADDPTRAASELIHQHDALLSLIQQAGLVEHFGEIRSPLGKARAAALQFVRRDAPEDRQQVLVEMLEQRLWLDVDREGVVTIGVVWPEPRTAAKIVEVTVQNFIQTRHAQEIAAITEAISILQDSVNSLQGDVDKTISQLRQEQANRPQARRERRPAAARADSSGTQAAASAAAASTEIIPAPPPARLVELGRLKGQLDATNQEVARLESQRRQQVADLEHRLTDALAIFTENHPTVSGLRQSLASASRESDDLISRRAEARQLEERLNALADQVVADGAAAVAAQQQQAAQTAATAPTPSKDPNPEPEPDPDAESGALSVLRTDATTLVDLTHPASRLLTLQLAQLANLLDRVNSARLELATSSAGLKYRYSVTRPPDVPKRPVKPDVLRMWALGVAVALMLAVGAAVALDLMGGILLEPWQLEFSVGAPLFATLPIGLVGSLPAYSIPTTQPANTQPVSARQSFERTDT